MLKSLFVAGAFLAAGTVGAQAQTLLDGTSVDEILNLARGYGAASPDTSSTGDPMISGKVDGVSYAIFFQNCTNGANCEDLRFYAGFASKPTLEMLNEWNRDKRWGKAYADSELDAVLEWDVNLVHGVTRQNLDNSMGVWVQVLDQFAVFIGAK
jgi:hypothetical protein